MCGGRRLQSCENRLGNRTGVWTFRPNTLVLLRDDVVPVSTENALRGTGGPKNREGHDDGSVAATDLVAGRHQRCIGTTSDGESGPIPDCQHRVAAAAASATWLKLMLAAAASGLDARIRDRDCHYRLEAVNGRASSLDGSVILLDDVIQVTVGSDLGVSPEQGLATQ